MKRLPYLGTMTTKIILRVRPDVHRGLAEWKKRAGEIPDPELRKQALMSIETKTFHCEGGSIYALLAGERYDEALRFIIAYQTISDYLDNLCDRSTSLDPDDFRALHESMHHALMPDAPATDYYRLRNEKDDGGYLLSLVATCQEVLKTLSTHNVISPALHGLCGYYCELQVHKHVRSEERVSRLAAWFDTYKDKLPPMTWYEFAACAGSTLGIFCIVANALREGCSQALVASIKEAYFPWVQGLHILLDYLIDQEEDRAGGDLNFCSYYPDGNVMTARLMHFYRQADQSISRLPNARFHHMINRGLLGMYLADKKVDRQKDVRKVARKMIRAGGMVTLFFFLHCWVYRRIKR
ncbi:MAG TPA: tetraprenyl-beta-curcumene synthase family protein [Syntrophales bacterium]|nr:tetraprenyl-beta-curcumene synthase family protein [Syntrophales bacterium]